MEEEATVAAAVVATARAAQAAEAKVAEVLVAVGPVAVVLVVVVMVAEAQVVEVMVAWVVVTVEEEGVRLVKEAQLAEVGRVVASVVGLETHRVHTSTHSCERARTRSDDVGSECLLSMD